MQLKKLLFSRKPQGRKSFKYQETILTFDDVLMLLLVSDEV